MITIRNWKNKTNQESNGTCLPLGFQLDLESEQSDKFFTAKFSLDSSLTSCKQIDDYDLMNLIIHHEMNRCQINNLPSLAFWDWEQQFAD